MRHRDLLLHTTILCGLALAPGVAFANPQGGNVAGGSATISSSGNTLTINQTSSRAIINWNSFDISSGETTQFQQPNSSAVALNRIGGNKPSQIDGTLTANGNIILVNPDGVVFGAGSQVNVNSLVVTNADTDNNAFMNGGKLQFSTPGSSDAQIIVKGQITVADAGLVGLVAPYVENQGVITARLGKVQLASGDTFTLDLAGDGITQVAVSGALAQQLAANTGTIAAEGGRIEITAAAAANVVNALVVNTGELKADSFQQRGGTIILSASNGTVTNSGSIYARGHNSGESGGNVTIVATHMQQQGTIDARGQLNGGNVGISFGDSYTDTSGSSILASGIGGNGGSISLIGAAGSGSTLTVSGTYEAASQYGKGGTIELFADAIKLTGATLDASGSTGGQITVGAVTSQSVAIDSATKVTADGTQGTGGSITVQGNTVNVAGTASAQGTTKGGAISANFASSYTDTVDATLTVASSGGSGGEVYVTGGDEATLTASGSYIADGGTTGGDIAMLTQEGNILLLGAYLSSRGPFGGGIIRIGGDFEGAEGTERSRYTTIDKNTLILADATGDGDGGKVAVWSDQETDFYGTISAMGGPNGGNGGYVETSGHYLNAQGAVFAGTWLLDPADLTIDDGSGSETNVSSSGTNPITWQTGSGDTGNSYLAASTIVSELNAGTSVILQTTNTGTGGNGDIFVNSAISATGSGSLTLSAYRDIVVNSAISLQGGNLTLDADNANNHTGKVEVNANITTNGGNLTIGGGSGTITAGSGYAYGDSGQADGVYINDATVNAGGGAIIINGQGYAGSAGSQEGVEINNSTVEASGTGTVTIYGTGGGNSSSTAGNDRGVYIVNSSTVSVVDGALIINGTGGGAGGSSLNDGSNDGISLYNGGFVETTGTGNVTLTGTGGSGHGGGNLGIQLYGIGGGSWVKSTNATGSQTLGTVTLNGTGGSGGGNDGIVLYQQITSVDGDITLNSLSNTGIVLHGNGNITSSGEADITVTSTDSISMLSAITASGTGNIALNAATDISLTGGAGLTTAGGNLTLITDSIDIGAANAIDSAGNLTLQPYTSGTTIGVGTNAIGSLNLTDTTLGNLTWGSGKTLTIGNASAGNMDINTASTFLNNGNVTLISGGTITLDKSGDTSPQTLSDTGSSNTTLTMQAGADIITAGAITASGTGKLNILLDSDYANANSGYISIGGNITTNGGYFTAGGGSGAITAGSGFAYSNSATSAGVNISVTVDAGGGNIIITGEGLNGSGFDYGISVNSVVKTSGSGTITLTGINSSSFAAEGIYLSSAEVQSASGGITLNGTSTVNGYGIESSSSTISSSSGDIALNGTGAFGIWSILDHISSTDGNISFTGSGTFGTVITEDSIQSTGSGNITFSDAVAGGGTDTVSANTGNVTFDSTVDGGSFAVTAGTVSFDAAVGGTTALTNFTITADNLTFGGNVKGTGTLTIAPSTAGRAITLNNGSTGFYLTTAEIGDIQSDWASVVIGSTSDTNTMTLGAATWNAPLTLLNGTGGITIKGAQSMGGNTFYANAGSGDITLGNGASITSNASGNAIVLAAGGNFINDSGSSTPFATPNGRFIGYSYQQGGDTNPVTYQQQITGYTYNTLPPANIASANGYDSSENTWVYAVAPSPAPSLSLPPSVTNPPVPTSAPAPASVPAPEPAPAPSPAPAPAPSPVASPAPAPAPSPAPASAPAPSPAPSSLSSPTAPPSQTSGNANNASSVPSDINGGESGVQLPGNKMAPYSGNGTLTPDYNANAGSAPASDEHPIAAPSSFKYLDDQLNKMDTNISDEQDEDSAGDVTRSASTITKATQKMVKQIVVPGIVSVGTASIGYVLLFGRTMYSALAMLMGLGLGSQKLDPATLLEYWEHESRKRDDHDKKVEGMFG